MRYRLKLGDAFVGRNIKHQVRVIGEIAAKLLWPVGPSIKRALPAEFRRRFCGPKFRIQIIMRNRCMARNLTDAFLREFERNRTV